MQDPHDSATDIAELLQHLIQLEVPQLPEDGEPAARLLRYSVRILNSRMAGGLVPESQSAEIARRRLVQAGRPSDALALSEAIGRLGAGHGMRNLPAALQMLCALMHSTPHVAMSSCAGAALLAREAPPAPPMPPLQHAHVAAPEPDVTPREAGGAPLSRGAKGAPSSGAVPGGTDEASERLLVRDVRERARVRARVGVRSATCSSCCTPKPPPDPDPDPNPNPNPNQVLFVLQNIDGATIKWDALGLGLGLGFGFGLGLG